MKFSETTFQDYLNAQAKIDMASVESIMKFVSNLQIQAAQSNTALAIIAPTWLMSDREKLVDFLPDFVDDDQRPLALRDFACVPVFSINPFFKNPAAIFARADGQRKCPIEDDLSISDIIELVPYPGARYFFAADLSINTDSIGIVLICKYPYTPDCYELVFSKQIKVSQDAEGDYEAIEVLIKMLRERRFNIQRVGFDKFQSHRTKKNLEKDGFEVEIVSYRDSLACNRTLKELVITGRLIYGDCDEVFMGEASELQVINNRRIDHLSSGGVFNSKDVWDAAVNATFLCMETAAPFVPEYV